MNDIVRLHVPPFEPTAPTSLAALRRPLVDADTVHCASQCAPCSVCKARHEAEVAAAAKLSNDLGLRLSQLVEDALDTHLTRIETQQAHLIATVLNAVLPQLVDTNLRSALSAELAAMTAPLRDVTLIVNKHPDLDLGPIPDGARLEIQDDPNHPRDSLSLRQGEGLTRIEPNNLIQACLGRIAEFSTSALPES